MPRIASKASVSPTHHSSAIHLRDSFQLPSILVSRITSSKLIEDPIATRRC
jgi:hypothetical protein